MHALYGVPTMFVAELDHPEFAARPAGLAKRNHGGLRPVQSRSCGASSRSMHSRQMTICYGMTETRPVSFQSSVDDPVERRVSTVGRVQPHSRSRSSTPDGRIVPRGDTGELLTRGYCVMLDTGRRGQTREAIDKAGWMHTGDLATIDEEGYCNIVGRVKDMIIRGGENIYPREIEEFLYQHPKMQDVQCIGVADAKYGEELCACIILREGERMTEQEIRGFCRGRSPGTRFRVTCVS